MGYIRTIYGVTTGEPLRKSLFTRVLRSLKAGSYCITYEVIESRYNYLTYSIQSYNI